jgi:hypothetical protein
VRTLDRVSPVQDRSVIRELIRWPVLGHQDQQGVEDLLVNPLVLLGALKSQVRVMNSVLADHVIIFGKVKIECSVKSSVICHI